MAQAEVDCSKFQWLASENVAGPGASLARPHDGIDAALLVDGFFGFDVG
jgi:hypothetical protein